MAGADWAAHHKDFGGALIEALVTRAAGLGPRDRLALLGAVAEGVRGKHLLAWHLHDAGVQDHLVRAGMDGGLRPGRGDYLMVVDTNVGNNKADRHVERSVAYCVAGPSDGPDDVPRITVRLTYTNRSPDLGQDCLDRSGHAASYGEMTQQCYWTYVRVLVPPGSTLVAAGGAEGAVDVGIEGPCTAMGALMLVPPAQSRTLELQYHLPWDVAEAAAREGVLPLRVQKQPGVVGTRLSVAAAGPDGGVVPVDTRHLDQDLDYLLAW